MSFTLQNETLTIGAQVVPLPDGLVPRHAVQHGGLVIVLGDGPGRIPDANVFAFDDAGKLVWRIEALKSAGDGGNPYTGLQVDAAGALKAYCWDGVWATVDARTGKVRALPGRPW